MKNIIIALILTLSIGSVNAQNNTAKKPITVSFGANFGAPLGKTTNADIQYVLGGDLMVGYGLTDKFRIGASAGFDVWHHAKGQNFNYVPVLAGIRYNITNRVFISERAGYAFGVSKDFTPGAGGMKIKGAFNNITGIGVKTGSNSDVTLAYKGLFYSGVTLNTIALRLAYRFGK